MISTRIIGLARRYAEPAIVATVLVGLYLANLLNFLLFFSLVKALIILLSFSIFILAWNTRRLQKDIFLLVIGYGSLSSAVLYLLHSLTDGVSMFPQLGINLSPQLLLGAMAVKGSAVLTASFFLSRKGSPAKFGAAFAALTALLLGAAFLQLLPPIYTDDGKTTLFMHACGIGIALLFLAAIVNLLRKKRGFNTKAYHLLIAALFAAAIATLMFAFDEIGTSASDFIRHCVRLLSWYLLYRAIILSGFVEPLARQNRTIRQQEADLRESEARFRAIYERSPVGIALLDSLSGVFLQVNPKYCEITGYDQQEMAQLTFQDITHSEDLQADQDNMDQLLEGKTRAFVTEKRYVRKDSSVVWVHVTVVPMWEEHWVEGSGPRQHLAMVEDITARKRAEQALRNERDRAQGYLDTVDTIIVALNAEGRITTINRKGCQVFGCSEEDLIGQHWFTACLPHPDGMDKVYPSFRKLMAGEIEATEYMENPIVVRSGAIRQVAWHNALLRDEQGRIIGTLSSGDDITERKQVELEREAMITTVNQMRVAAEKRADELAAIFATLTEPVVIYSTAGDIVHANRAAYSLKGFDPFLVDISSKKTILQMRSRDGSLLAPDWHPAARALDGETIVSESLLICDIQGRDIIGHVSAAPFHSNGVLQGAIVVWHDITELEQTKAALQLTHDELEKRVLARTAELATSNRLLRTEIEERLVTEHELVQSREQLRNLSLHLQSVLEREREDIAREIHDELGQSLTAIKLDLSWLYDQYGDHSKLIKKIDAMEGLINSSIITVKRIASELRPAILDHLGLAAAVEWQMKEFAMRTGIDCRLTIKPEDLVADHDRSTALFRILQEALTNVIRHAEASEVLVSLGKADGQISLQVQDNGKGFSQEQAADHRSFGLMGIRERVLFFDGDVDIRSREPAEGTSITIRIPLEKAQLDSFRGAE